MQFINVSAFVQPRFPLQCWGVHWVQLCVAVLWAAGEALGGGSPRKESWHWAFASQMLWGAEAQPGDQRDKAGAEDPAGPQTVTRSDWGCVKAQGFLWAGSLLRGTNLRCSVLALRWNYFKDPMTETLLWETWAQDLAKETLSECESGMCGESNRASVIHCSLPLPGTSSPRSGGCQWLPGAWTGKFP